MNQKDKVNVMNKTTYRYHLNALGILPGIKNYKLTFYDKTTGEYLGDREMQFVDH